MFQTLYLVLSTCDWNDKKTFEKLIDMDDVTGSAKMLTHLRVLAFFNFNLKKHFRLKNTYSPLTKAVDTLGNFLSNVARHLCEMLPSTGNQVRHGAHDQSKISR